MGCERKQLVLPWMMLAAKPSAGIFLPCGAWVDPGDADSARSFGEMRGKTSGGTFTATPCLQYTNDVRSPVGQVQIGSSLSADGVLDPTSATSIATAANYRFVRPGWWVVGDNTNLCLAMLGGVIVLFKA